MSTETRIKTSLSVAMITYNEEQKLHDCLRSVPFADEFVIIDSNSTDKTRDIAATFGAKVFIRPFTDFASQKNAAIDKTIGEWILLLDADERLSQGLADEIKAVISDPRSLDAYSMKRKNILFGGHMRFGANRNDWQLRLVRRSKARFEGLVHERIKLEESTTGYFKGELIHFSHQTVKDFFIKFDRFCSLDAEVTWRRGHPPTIVDFVIRPIVHFVWFYFVKLGILDGPRGFVYQRLSSYYIFTKYRKVRGLYRTRGKPPCDEESLS